ncbi:MAG: M23 family metallopeptidase [Patescibacteria group bacterium]|nr:M23 family metallopeptidase [Patescibacteria group bacterium]MDD4443461.1 M23 family metallopeptidase [Patescibacteria group bacterium]NCU39378.1 LysM peptidoglycan-binding domain-containing protein [Candidatus Falkowbacteria bacterium]
MLFNLFFKRILVKIYFEIFRLKKGETKEKTTLSLLKKNLAYFSIIFLTVLFILSNIQAKNQVHAASENKISQTIMSHLIENQFSAMTTESEELIADSYIPNRAEEANQEKYYQEALVEKNYGANTETNGTSSPEAIIVNEEAMAVKPKGLNIPNLSDSAIDGAQRTETINYTVSSGDTISSISQNFGITINTILWANNLSANSIIRPGDTLIILPYSGVTHTVKSGDTLSKIAQSYDVSEDKIIASNNLGSVLKIGEKLMIPGGSKKSTVVAARPSTPSPNTGISIIKDLVTSPSTNEPVTSEGKMLWPTEGKRITQYYSWSHTGLDIANKTGTPLYAAEAGTVEYSGWSNGYGYNVLINHGGGKKTRYAHASKLFVEVGDQVERGENIAAMGSTGWSTGPHIHFEVIINGKKYNPLNYIK